MAVSGGYAYVATLGGVFTVIDVSNPDAPSIAATLRNKTYFTQAVRVALSGNYAYVISNAPNDRLTVVDISTPTAPSVVASLRHTDLGDLSGLTVSGSYAYVTGYAADKMTVVNISTPSSPSIAGTYSSATNLDGPLDIAISGSYAYVASTVGNSLTRLNITTPATPTYVNKYSNATNLNGVTSVAISGSYVYATAYAGNRVTVMDISNVGVAPALTTSLNDGTFLAGLNDIVISGNYVYPVGDLITTSDHLIAVNISTPSAPVVEGSLLPKPNSNTTLLPNGVAGMGGFGGAYKGITASGGYLYSVGNMTNYSPSAGDFRIIEPTSAFTAITKDELNATIASGSVWTGSAFDGTSSGDYCNTSSTDWRATTATPKGTTGNIVKTTRQWTNNSTTTACNTSNRLYCIQQ